MATAKEAVREWGGLSLTDSTPGKGIVVGRKGEREGVMR
jgi:hypothetical protein